MRGGFANILPASRETAHGIKQLRMAAPPIVSFGQCFVDEGVGRSTQPGVFSESNPTQPFGTGVPQPADGRLLLPSRHGSQSGQI